MTITSADIHFDMYDRDLYASPYPMYRRMRDQAPLYRNEQYDFWALTRFDDVAKVLTDRDTFSSAKGGVYQVAAAEIELPLGLFIFEDPPIHTVHRRLISRLFTPRAVSAIENRVRRSLRRSGGSPGRARSVRFRAGLRQYVADSGDRHAARAP